jgi:hypothetical protein
MRIFLPQPKKQACRPGRTHRNQKRGANDNGFRMPGRTIELPKSGFAIEIDGRLKTQFSTKEGAEHGAIELKRRFPMLQIRIYDAGTQSRHELPA